MIYSYKNFPFGETVTGRREINMTGSRSNMEWVLNNKLGIAYIGRSVGGSNTKKEQKNPQRVRQHIAQTA